MQEQAIIPYIVNVSSIPNRSIFRYPGGKTWLVPIIRKWLPANNDIQLIEPFCGGGIVGLTAAAENRVCQATLIEKDPDVAAAWHTLLDDPDWLIDRILHFRMTTEQINVEENRRPATLQEKGFQTILRNRTHHGGILAQGAGRIKAGENGKGLSSRWYPDTLAKRISSIAAYRSKIKFHEGDAFDYITAAQDRSDTYFFIDPPYTVAGKRLYTYSTIDHELLFQRVAAFKNAHYLISYDKSDLIESLVQKYHLCAKVIPMRTNKLTSKEEILISDTFAWL